MFSDLHQFRVLLFTRLKPTFKEGKATFLAIWCLIRKAPVTHKKQKTLQVKKSVKLLKCAHKKVQVCNRVVEFFQMLHVPFIATAITNYVVTTQ